MAEDSSWWEDKVMKPSGERWEKTKEFMAGPGGASMAGAALSAVQKNRAAILAAKQQDWKSKTEFEANKNSQIMSILQNMGNIKV